MFRLYGAILLKVSVYVLVHPLPEAVITTYKNKVLIAVNCLANSIAIQFLNACLQGTNLPSMTFM